MFAGIYYGGMYGGSTTSILLNTPGESASIVTALEGNKMARAGRGGPALATAAIGSFIAGLIATLALAFVAPWVVKFALSFGPSEYFALMLLAFMTVSAAFGDSTLRGLTSLFIGLGLGLIGIDQLTGQARLVMGTPNLLDGINVTTLAVALFAIGETLAVVSKKLRPEDEVIAVKGSVWMTKTTGNARGCRGCAVPPSAFPSGPCLRAALMYLASFPIRRNDSSRNIRKNSVKALSKALQGQRQPTMLPLPERSSRF